jgi:hypothetical protein
MFINDGYSGIELENALHAHARMGYNFMVSKVGVIYPNNLRDDQSARVDVTVMQVGVAPFYYPLSLFLDCPDLTRPREMTGVESLLVEGDAKTFSFTNIPRTPSCMNDVTLFVNSSYAYSGRPIKFSQGQTGNVKLGIPIPTTKNDSPDDSKEMYMVWSLINTNTDVDDGNTELETGTSIDLAQVGRSVTIRVDVFNSDSQLQTRNIAVNFQYNDMVHVERWSPYVLNGNWGKNYKNSEYLNTIGTKTIQAIVTNKIDKSILLKRRIEFDIIDTERIDMRPAPAPVERSMSEAFSSFLFVSPENSTQQLAITPTKAPIQMNPTKIETSNDCIHGFNTPSTPPLLVLEERRRYIAFRNHVIYSLVFGILIVLTLVLCIQCRRRCTRRKKRCANGQVSPYGDIIDKEVKKLDTLTDVSCTKTIKKSTEIQQNNNKLFMQQLPI